jgi:putative Mg2+ transporter-C (MgtC) family protein
MENFILNGGDLYLRLVVAMVLGMLIGTERIIAHKTVGVRTYALITMGAALFVLVSQMVGQIYLNSFNISNIPAAIITGIGFLGTGLMIKKDDHPLGITSAASFWISAGIGMACGFGFFNLAIFATILVLFIFVVLWFVEQKIKKMTGYVEEEQIKNI